MSRVKDTHPSLDVQLGEDQYQALTALLNKIIGQNDTIIEQTKAQAPAEPPIEPQTLASEAPTSE